LGEKTGSDPVCYNPVETTGRKAPDMSEYDERITAAKASDILLRLFYFRKCVSIECAGRIMNKK
jgi:hypothetical protein